MDIATQTPAAHFDGRFSVITVHSGSKQIEIALDAHHCMALARQMQAVAREAFESHSRDNIVAFERWRNAD